MMPDVDIDYQPGERYVVRYADGDERLARVERAGGATALQPVSGRPLPEGSRVCDAWPVGPRDRLAFDGRRFWCVGSRALPGGRWSLRFDRFFADGGGVTVFAESAADPLLLTDAELCALLPPGATAPA